MRSLLLALGLFALSPAPPARQSTCPFTTIDVVSFGAGTGVCADSVLGARLDSNTCDLEFFFELEPFACGNVFLTRTLLVAGPAPLAQPISLGAPFLPGSELLVVPGQVMGPFPGETVSLQVPGDATLVGQSLSFQSVPFFFSTIPHPGQTDLGLSTGLTVTLR